MSLKEGVTWSVQSRGKGSPIAGILIAVGVSSWPLMAHNTSCLNCIVQGDGTGLGPKVDSVCWKSGKSTSPGDLGHFLWCLEAERTHSPWKNFCSSERVLVAKGRGSPSTGCGIIYALLQHGKRTLNVPFIRPAKQGGRVPGPSLMTNATTSN